MTGRAIDPVRSAQVAPTGLAGRPIPVEQAADRPQLFRTFVRQLIQPFTTEQGVQS